MQDQDAQNTYKYVSVVAMNMQQNTALSSSLFSSLQCVFREQYLSLQVLRYFSTFRWNHIMPRVLPWFMSSGRFHFVSYTGLSHA